MNPELRTHEAPLTLEAVVFEIINLLEHEQTLAREVESAVSYMMFVDSIEKEMATAH